MANVLPQKERRRFEREYQLRIGIVISILWILSLAFGGVLLLPSYFVSKLKEESIVRQSELLQKAIAIYEGDTSAGSLVTLRKKITALEEVQGQVLHTEVLRTIIKDTDQATSVDAFYYTKAVSGGSQMKITGRAASRTALTSFADRLKQEQLFNSVELPVSSLAKDSNIVFSITLRGDF